MYHIISIDGVDGSGKTTQSAILEKKLKAMGFEVLTVDFPQYQSLPGQMVKEYLSHGSGSITSREVLSQLYSMDRNWWMKDHFDWFLKQDDPSKLPWFNPNSDRIILYNRNWISNLLYQTTPIMQSEEMARHMMPYRIYWSESGSTKHVRMDEAYCYALEHPDDTAFVEDFTENRIDYIQEHMNLIWNMEIAPWTAIRMERAGGTFLYDNFVMAASTVTNLVLSPNPQSYHILKENMMKRYQNDEGKMDINESSIDFMVSVMENINWIHENAKSVYDEVDGWGENTYPIKKAFSYDIIRTTDSQNEQKEIGIIASEIWNRVEDALRDTTTLFKYTEKGRDTHA